MESRAATFSSKAQIFSRAARKVASPAASKNNEWQRRSLGSTSRLISPRFSRRKITGLMVDLSTPNAAASATCVMPGLALIRVSTPNSPGVKSKSFSVAYMLIGIDDTDSPAGMCTTYLGAVLARRLIREHMRVREARLVRLNPNVTLKTRGNAAVMLDVEGDPDRAFAIACALVEELADFSCENTNPGVVVTDQKPDPAFYKKAVTDFCTIEEAVAILDEAGARYRGWKNRRGLIGATAAVASDLPDETSEILVYREPARFGTPRSVDRQSLFDAEAATFPHTWDTVDTINDVVVCVPHTPDPVLFGIRGESPQWVMAARQMIDSEKPGIEQIWVTNQGTDAHLLNGTIGELREGLSYRVRGTVAESPEDRHRRPRLVHHPGWRHMPYGAWPTSPRRISGRSSASSCRAMQ